MDTAALHFKLALLALSLLFLPSLQATYFQYCDTEANYVAKVSGIDISPNPVVRGKPATFNISASTGKAISGGKAVIDVYYFGVHIHQEIHPLCEETSCPIAVGNFVLSHNQVLPGFTPPGSYTLRMNLFGDGDSITCISFGFKIVLGTSGSSVSNI
ncbi:hypothetical protein like AT3G11780 [Hibiscus trionum]|uniref:MD-2-related lipid-recognition domain-containing protein n=1 Tax=Hibiscus trionum TaxID=183268 RepID=A0A9W7IFZ7_HIBTR|nr:hypothetical protein like AT3G11780 [Hibiscus trionum]